MAMNRLMLSFFITLALYLLLLWALWFDAHHTTLPPHHAKYSIQGLKILKPTPKPSPILTRHPKTHSTNSHPKPIKKQKKPKNKPKPSRKHKHPKKILKKLAKTKHKKYKKRIQKEHNQTIPSLQALFAKNTPQKVKTGLSKLPLQLRKLYKDDFSTFTKEQKKFLQNNLSKIATITQKYLYLRGYPHIAIKTRQEGTNAVEFLLHPNGDISQLRLLTSSRYEALDKNSIETIKTAFKDYPRPKSTTKIKIYIRYSIIY